MPRRNHDIACAKIGSCVLTLFSVAYTTSISGRQRALIEFLRMTAANMSRICDSLVTRELITRVRSARDRRRIVLRITEQGADLVWRVLAQRMFLTARG